MKIENKDYIGRMKRTNRITNDSDSCTLEQIAKALSIDAENICDAGRHRDPELFLEGVVLFNLSEHLFRINHLHQFQVKKLCPK